MEVTISGNLITILRDDGTEQVINGLNVVDEGGIRWEQYNTAPPVLSSDPYTQPNPTFVDRYKVVLHFNDNRWEDIPLGTVTNQPTWTDDLTGAAAAVSDLSAALVVSGGGGGGVSSVTASSPLASSGGANPNITFTTPGSDTQVLLNNSGVPGASADLTFDGSLLGVGNDSGNGIVELGDVGGSGEVSSPGTMNVEGQDIGISAGDTVTISTAAQSRLAIDADGAFGVNGSDGTDGQVLTSRGSGAEAEWDDLLAENVGMDTFFFATVNGVRSLYIEVFQGVDPPNRYWSVNGVESTDDAIFGTSGAWVVNEAGNTVGASTDAVANPTLVTAWTGSATVVVEPVLYGPTVQDALEQLADQVSAPTIEMVVTQTGTNAPVAVAIRKTNTNVDVSFGREEEGLFYLTAPGFITTICLMQISSNEQGKTAYISRIDDDSAYFGYNETEDGCAFSITLKQL